MDCHPASGCLLYLLTSASGVAVLRHETFFSFSTFAGPQACGADPLTNRAHLDTLLGLSDFLADEPCFFPSVVPKILDRNGRGFAGIRSCVRQRDSNR